MLNLEYIESAKVLKMHTIQKVLLHFFFHCLPLALIHLFLKKDGSCPDTFCAAPCYCPSFDLFQWPYVSTPYMQVQTQFHTYVKLELHPNYLFILTSPNSISQYVKLELHPNYLFIFTSPNSISEYAKLELHPNYLFVLTSSN